MREIARWPFRPRFSVLELLLISGGLTALDRGDLRMAGFLLISAGLSAWLWRKMVEDEPEKGS